LPAVPVLELRLRPRDVPWDVRHVPGNAMFRVV